MVLFQLSCGSKRYFRYDSRVFTRVMSFGMGVFEYLIEFVTRYMTEEIKTCFFEEPHYLVMDIFALWVLGQAKNALSSIIVVSRRGSISVRFLFNFPFRKVFY